MKYTRVTTCKLLMGNPSHRLFYSSKADKHYLVDDSGSCPESCSDGPLAVLMDRPSVWVNRNTYLVDVESERNGKLYEVLVNADIAYHLRDFYEKPIDYSKLV